MDRTTPETALGRALDNRGFRADIGQIPMACHYRVGQAAFPQNESMRAVELE